MNADAGRAEIDSLRAQALPRGVVSATTTSRGPSGERR